MSEKQRSQLRVEGGRVHVGVHSVVSETGLVADLLMTVREYNVFRWAGRMLLDAARLRLRQRIEARVQLHQIE